MPAVGDVSERLWQTWQAFGNYNVTETGHDVAPGN
jgi:hypothetical protein